jgi:hypothetical protein
MYQNIPTKVLTGEVRLSYANLTAPRAAQQGGDAKYGVTLLIPKSDTATYQDIINSIEAAAQEAQGKLWNGVRPPVLPQPLHDGDGVRENGTAYGPECKGHWVMTASTKNKPQVVHQSNINTELAPQDIYSGMRARVTINFFGYLNNGKKGVGCGLGNVMKTRDDEPLAGGASADADFAGVGATAPAAAPGAPTYPQQPQQYAAPAQPQYAPPAPPQYGGVPAGASPVNPLTGLPY